MAMRLAFAALAVTVLGASSVNSASEQEDLLQHVQQHVESPKILRFALTRKHIDVPINSNLHHRYGIMKSNLFNSTATSTAATTGSSSSSLSLRQTSSSSSSRSTQDEVGIYGDFRRLAYFFADVFIGSMPQKFTVITDTGSSLTAVPCISCTDCGTHMNPRFDPAKSTSAHVMSCSSGGCPGSSHCSSNICQYTQSYAEGSSLRGTLYRDSVYIGGDNSGGPAAAFSMPFTFGCGTHEGGLFVSQEADGIMGLGQSDMSITRALWDAHKLDANIFSLCLSLRGGAFTLGAIDTRLHTAPISWARMSLTGFYVVPVTGMFVGETPITASRFNSPHTILDSGTTFTYVPSDTYNDLRSTISSYCAADRATRCKGTPTQVPNEPYCFILAAADLISTYPSARIQLAGIDGAVPVMLDIPPSHLFINMGWDGGAYCLSIYDNGDRGGVIGANAMMGHDVIFDMVGGIEAVGPRAGFAPSECQLPAEPIVPVITPTPSPTASPIVAASPSTLASPGASGGEVSSASPFPTTAASPSSSSSSSIDDKTSVPPPLNISDSSSNTMMIASVVVGTILACIAAYYCLSCECRVGRLVFRLEGKNNTTTRYQRVDAETAGNNNNTSTAVSSATGIGGIGRSIEDEREGDDDATESSPSSTIAGGRRSKAVRAPITQVTSPPPPSATTTTSITSASTIAPTTPSSTSSSGTSTTGKVRIVGAISGGSSSSGGSVESYGKDRGSTNNNNNNNNRTQETEAMSKLAAALSSSSASRATPKQDNTTTRVGPNAVSINMDPNGKQ